MKKLVIVGAGGFGREVAWTVARINAGKPTFELLGFLDDNPALRNTSIDGNKVLGATDELPPDAAVFCAIGNNLFREKFLSGLLDKKVELATLIDPSATIAPTATIGGACYIGINAVVSVGAKLGIGTIVNHQSCVGHDVTIGDGGQLCPGSCISGNCRLGKRVMVATLAGSIPGRTIGDDATIGAGVVAYRDLDAEAVLASTAGVRCLNL